MVQIIPAAKRKPSFGQSVLGALNTAGNIYGQHKQKEALTSQGIDPNLPEEFQRMAYQNKLQSEQQGEKLRGKQEQELQSKLAPLIGAKSSIDKMRQLREKGNLGRGSSVFGFFGGDTAKERGEYQTLGNSLIQFASSIPIRNRQEFEKLAGHIGDPSITDSEAEGVLNAMEKLIEDSASQYLPQNEMQMKKEESSLESLDPESASKYSGKTVEDENGNRFRSNGKKWIKL